MFEPNFEACDVLFDLLDEGQMLSQLRQALVRLDPRPLDRGRTGGDKNRIKLVVLGPAQMHPRIGLDLDRLQNENGKSFFSQMSDHAAFVAAAGLDADTCDPGFGEFGSQEPPTDWCVVELPALGPA